MYQLIKAHTKEELAKVITNYSAAYEYVTNVDTSTFDKLLDEYGRNIKGINVFFILLKQFFPGIKSYSDDFDSLKFWYDGICVEIREREVYLRGGEQRYQLFKDYQGRLKALTESLEIYGELYKGYKKFPFIFLSKRMQYIKGTLENRINYIKTELEFSNSHWAKQYQKEKEYRKNVGKCFAYLLKCGVPKEKINII